MMLLFASLLKDNQWTRKLAFFFLEKKKDSVEKQTDCELRSYRLKYFTVNEPPVDSRPGKKKYGNKQKRPFK